MGVMTDWIPVNMNVDPNEPDSFFIEVNLPKNFEHRFLFEYDDQELFDPTQPHSLDANMRWTNTVFVG